MKSEFEIAQSKVLRYCAEVFPNATKNDEGQIFVEHESTLVVLEVKEVEYTAKMSTFRKSHELPAHFVKIMAVLLLETPLNPSVYQWVSTTGHEQDFGHVEIYPQDNGTGALVYTYSLVADTLDPSELKWGVLFVAHTADKLDDELKARFGGKRHEDLENEENAL